MTRRFARPLALLAPAALVLAGCSGEPSGEAQAQAAPADTRVPVSVRPLETGRAEATVRAWATVRPAQSADMLAEVSGTLTQVHVNLGEPGRKGHALLEIGRELHTPRVREAEAALESAKLSSEKLRKDLERAKSLYERGSVSDSDSEAARSRYAEAVAGEAAAAAALALARKNLAAAVLRAPFDGHLASRPLDPGSTVNPGMLLAKVVDINTVGVIALVSERDLANVHLGDEASVSVESITPEPMSGTVVTMGPQADPETRQYPVEIEVPNPGHLLKGGMVAGVEIVYETLEDVPLLPVSALVDDGRAFYVVANGTAERREASLGPRVDQSVALLSGGAPGDSVVVIGQGRLAPGTPVQVEALPR